MSFAIVVRAGRPRSPLSVVAALLVVLGIGGVLRDRLGSSTGGAIAACQDPSSEACRDTGLPDPFAAPKVVQAEEVCRDAGYLCVELENRDRVFVRRWIDFTGTLVVHVPAPDFEDRTRARQLQRAAAAGVRAWNGQPFPIAVDERGTREAHIRVRWEYSLGGMQIGRAQTTWSAATGLRVRSLDLASRGAGSGLDASAVRLVAAHEMGHALGLPHSDSPRDVMYPTNTANIVSARDHKTMQALYALDDGTEIVR